MKKIELNATLRVYPDMGALPEPLANLMKLAIDARGKAYAPYSNFYVGAAILLDNGQIVQGNNQENAAFPSGLCAERVAVYHAGASFPGAVIKAVAITAASPEFTVADPVAPCGACRQALAEYEYRQKSPMEICFMGDDSEVYVSDSIRQLLPLVFTEKDLREK